MLQSQWNKWNADPRLNSATMAHIGKDALNSKKDWWIEIDFAQTHEVYQVILKRRGDALKSYKDRTNPTIWIQY